MQDTPRVAVVVPYYKGRRFLGAALRSALSQTYPAIRIVVVNDGSGDCFKDAIDPFRSRVDVVEQENRGVAAARNRAIESSDSEYLAFLDQDDVWREDKIERQVRIMEATPRCGLMHTAATCINADGAPIERPAPPFHIPKASGWCTRDLLAHNSITMSSVLLRRSALGPERFPAGVDGSDDWDLWLRLSREWMFEYLDEPLTFYRVHDTNVSSLNAVMIRGQVGVLERALARSRSGELEAAARQHLRAAIRHLAHLEYERGDLKAARRLFVASSTWLERLALVRYFATFLPPSLHPRMQAVWRAATGLGTNAAD